MVGFPRCPRAGAGLGLLSLPDQVTSRGPGWAWRALLLLPVLDALPGGLPLPTMALTYRGSQTVPPWGGCGDRGTWKGLEGFPLASATGKERLFLKQGRGRGMGRWFGELHLFPGAAITKHHKTRAASNHRNVFSLSSGGHKSEVQVSAGPGSLWRGQRRVLPASASFWLKKLLEVLGFCALTHISDLGFPPPPTALYFPRATGGLEGVCGCGLGVNGKILGLQVEFAQEEMSNTRWLAE